MQGQWGAMLLLGIQSQPVSGMCSMQFLLLFARVCCVALCLALRLSVRH